MLEKKVVVFLSLTPALPEGDGKQGCCDFHVNIRRPMTTPTLDALLCSRPASLTLAHAEACLPTFEVNPEWQAKHDAGTLPEGMAGLIGSLRTVWPEEMLTEPEARWILALREHLSWRSLADFLMGDGNQITGMHLEEAARRTLELNTPSDRESRSCEPVRLGTTWFITRHPGAREWAREEGVAIDRLVTHLDPEDVQPGDTVLGTLPVNLAAEICARGARYFHLSLDLPAEWRGRELTAEDMRRFGAVLAEYRVEPVARSLAPRGNAAPDALRPATSCFSSPPLDESHTS